VSPFETEELETAYTSVLGLAGGDGGGGGDSNAFTGPGSEVARRRLRLIERPAPPAADRLAAFSGGVSACAAIATIIMWCHPAPSSPPHCPRCVEYLAACVPAFRLTAMPIVWMWCWVGTRFCCDLDIHSHLPTHPLTYSPTHPLTHPPTHPLTRPHAHSDCIDSYSSVDAVSFVSPSPATATIVLSSATVHSHEVVTGCVTWGEVRGEGPGY
jgi:hypothetical protein